MTKGNGENRLEEAYELGNVVWYLKSMMDLYITLLVKLFLSFNVLIPFLHVKTPLELSDSVKMLTPLAPFHNSKLQQSMPFLYYNPYNNMQLCVSLF